MTLRAGGVSKPPFDTMNLGSRVGDRPESVARNRELFRSAIPARTVLLNQAHGVHAVVLTSETENGVEADACVTREPGVACCILVADCLPMLFTNRQGSAVAAAHAGWRGLAGTDGRGVVESTYLAFRAAVLAAGQQHRSALGEVALDTVAAQTQVWLGPCIGPSAFEVGDEVRRAFVLHDAAAAALFRPGRPGKFHADLQGLARQRLAALGITRVHGNDGATDWCTYSDRSRFFSHRRDQLALGGSGRMAAAVWLNASQSQPNT